ncbi:MAG TPA: betaine/proline/choline family ABC transporter ATP-binding protein [Acidimicrobiales bacterium]|nr:betaine/proline/choline family ABC transporter ATP-binding protein [Acidimicrobiales bacterium]
MSTTPATGAPTASPPTPDAPAIRLREVTKRFPGAAADAVAGLSLDVAKGSIVALLGPSGCGKTTTLRMINRMIEPTSGRIEIEGRDVTRTPVAELRRGIGYVIQQVGLFPHHTVARNIAAVPNALGWDKDRTRARIRELADLVGLEPTMLDRYPDELSGGQQQRVGVARALAADPPVLLMDEPFGAVDPVVRSRLQDELLGLQSRVHKTIVLVTHDLDEAIRLADRIALLDVGGVLEQYDTPDDLLRAPANEFVERFVGGDRSLRRLTLATVADLPFARGPVVDLATASADEAGNVMDAHRSDWFGLTAEGVFLGWVPRTALDTDRPLAELPRTVPAAHVAATSTLRAAMEIIMTSDTSVAVVDDGGRFGGVITLERIRAALAADGGPAS